MKNMFYSRSTASELIDSQNISFGEFHHCLQTLEKINLLTFAYRPVLGWIKKLTWQQERLSILDAGSGGGDMLRRLAKQNPLLNLTGIDLNPWSKLSAELVTPQHLQIRHVTGDVFSFQSDDDIDVIISSLFTHHLDDDQLVHFLQWMDRTAKRGWFINDLHRHVLPYYFIKYAVRLFCSNRLIRHDAPLSVARSFTKADWEGLLHRSGVSMEGIEIKWYFPFRYCVSCEKR